MSLPTFIIGGAPRCGTTLLYHWLERHPDIFLASPVNPEPKFFLVDEEYQRGLDYYEEKYFAAADTDCRGEKSTNYLEDSLVPRRIAKDLPEVKLVFVLRDPVERAYSNYLWSKMNRLETLDFASAIEREAEREGSYPEKWKYARPFSYVSRGMYARHLARFFDALGRQRILVLLLEELLARPDEQIETVLRFLGVAPKLPAIDPARRVNTARSESDPALPAKMRKYLMDIYRQPARDLETLLERRIACWQVP